jgi:hypothetical protein
MIRFACPHCGKTFTGADDLTGQHASCRQCGKLFVVGATPTAAARPALSQPPERAPISQHQAPAPPPVRYNPTPAPPPSLFQAEPALPAPLVEEQHTWTLDDSARASRPGNLRVNRWRWFRHYPKWPMIWFSSLAFFVVMACLVHGSFWIFATLLLAMNWLYWQRVSDHFRHGCANPAIILSLQPMRIAVSTDLTKGVGNYPVIKIIQKSLPTACGQQPRVGTLLATVSLYFPSSEEEPHWSDFDPRPIDCATGDLDAMQRVMSGMDANDWNELRNGLKQLPRPYRCGLYHVLPSE